MSNTIPSTNMSLKDDLHIKWTNANGHELIVLVQQIFVLIK